MAEGPEERLTQGLQRARLAYERSFGLAPRLLAYGPGRINIIGEHTDYNQGLAMPAAIDRWVVAAFGARQDRVISMRSEDFDQSLESALGQQPELRSSWQRFAWGALSVFGQRFPLQRGLQVAIAGDVPLDSGLSSSAALEVALMNGLRALYGVRLEDGELIRLCQRVEHEHLGLASGLLDQLASQCSLPGRPMLADFRSGEHRPLRSGLQGWQWLVVHSGRRRALADSAYQQRVDECARGLAVARRFDPLVAGFRNLRPWHLQVLEELGQRVPAMRLRHVIEENRRVRAAARALAEGDGATLGRLLVQSHRSLRHLYQVSCRELDQLVEAACRWPGCAGARMMGGGFGGCSLNLVRAGQLPGFTAHLEREIPCAGQRARPSWRVELVGGGGVVRDL